MRILDARRQPADRTRYFETEWSGNGPNRYRIKQVGVEKLANLNIRWNCVQEGDREGRRVPVRKVKGGILYTLYPAFGKGLANINEDYPKPLTVLPKATPSRNRPELGALSLSEWKDTREAVNTPKNDRTIHQIALSNKYTDDRTRLNKSHMPPGLPTII